MKKSILIVLLALFAGFTNLQAQDCTGTPFQPAAGVPYTYTVTIGVAPEYVGTGFYNWYVTQNVDLLNAGAIIPEINPFFTVNETAPNANYYDPNNTKAPLNLTWTVDAVMEVNPFYLVLRYKEDNTLSNPTCNAENIRVWQIDPMNTFLLAIEGANADGSVFANANQCAASLVSAVVTPGATPTVEYTYGTNTLYYRVTASGILGEWRPSLRLPALGGLGQVYVSAEWNTQVDGSGTWYPFTGAAGSTGGDFVSAQNATVTDDVNGTPILIRVVINNENYETLADQPITAGIDGYLPTDYTESDTWGDGYPNPCGQADPFAKEATYTIMARPSIDPGAGMNPFITKTP